MWLQKVSHSECNGLQHGVFCIFRVGQRSSSCDRIHDKLDNRFAYTCFQVCVNVRIGKRQELRELTFAVLPAESLIDVWHSTCTPGTACTHSLPECYSQAYGDARTDRCRCRCSSRPILCYARVRILRAALCRYDAGRVPFASCLHPVHVPRAVAWLLRVLYGADDGHCAPRRAPVHEARPHIEFLGHSPSPSTARSRSRRVSVTRRGAAGLLRAWSVIRTASAFVLRICTSCIVRFLYRS